MEELFLSSRQGVLIMSVCPQFSPRMWFLPGPREEQQVPFQFFTKGSTRPKRDLLFKAQLLIWPIHKLVWSHNSLLIFKKWNYQIAKHCRVQAQPGHGKTPGAEHQMQNNSSLLTLISCHKRSVSWVMRFEIWSMSKATWSEIWSLSKAMWFQAQHHPSWWAL